MEKGREEERSGIKEEKRRRRRGRGREKEERRGGLIFSGFR